MYKSKKFANHNRYIYDLYHDLFMILILLGTVVLFDTLILSSISGWWAYTTKINGLMHMDDGNYRSGPIINGYCLYPNECSDRFCTVIDDKYDLIGIHLNTRKSCTNNHNNAYYLWNNIEYTWAYILTSSMIGISIMLSIVITICHLIKLQCYYDSLYTMISMCFIIDNLCIIMLRILQIIYWNKIITCIELYYFLQGFSIAGQIFIIMTHRTGRVLYIRCCVDDKRTYESINESLRNSLQSSDDNMTPTLENTCVMSEVS